MYIIVRKSDNMIVGTAINKVNTTHAEKNGQVVYEIDKNEFKPEMIGTILKGFEEL